MGVTLNGGGEEGGNAQKNRKHRETKGIGTI